MFHLVSWLHWWDGSTTTAPPPSGGGGGGTLPPPPLTASPTRYSSVDLLAMCKDKAGRPAVDAQMPDESWYRLLTEAQDALLPEIAYRAPAALAGQYATLQTDDGGRTYNFGLDVYGEPLVPLGHVEVWAREGGRRLFAASYDSGGDFVIDGNRIRFPGDRVGRFSDGPYARWTGVPPAITEAVQPIIQPRPMRVLLVYYAVMLWSERGGRRDPAPWRQGFTREWMGDPSLGKGGWCAFLQTRFQTEMAAASSRPNEAWWQASDWTGR